MPLLKGPWGRGFAVLGLLLLAPTALLLARGDLAPLDATVRGLLTLGGVVLAHRLAVRASARLLHVVVQTERAATVAASPDA